MLKLIVMMIIIQCFANAYMQTELINPNNRFGNQMNKYGTSFLLAKLFKRIPPKTNRTSRS